MGHRSQRLYIRNQHEYIRLSAGACSTRLASQPGPCRPSFWHGARHRGVATTPRKGSFDSWLLLVLIVMRHDRWLV